MDTNEQAALTDNEAVGEIKEFESIATQPVKGAKGYAWILYGSGVPCKFCFFEPGIDEKSILWLANEQGLVPYIHAERVQSGMLSVHHEPYQGTDHTHSGEGWCLGEGKDEEQAEHGDRELADVVINAPVSAWFIKQKDKLYVFITPTGLNSQEIATALGYAMPQGVFGVKPFFIGQVTLDEYPFTPGFATLVQPFTWSKAGYNSKH